MERDASPRRVVDAKYGSLLGGGAQGWCPNLVQGPYGVCLWKSIRKGWDVFCGCVSFKV